MPDRSVEDVREILVGDPGAVVPHDELSVVQLDLDLGAGRAPLRRVVEQVPDRALDRGGHTLDRRRLEIDGVDDAGPVPARPLDDIGDEQVEPHVLRLHAYCSARASSMSSEISVVISPSCSTTSESSRAALLRRRAFDRPPSTSMFVRTLVSGVRSSCDASATSWRCARVDSSRAAEHRVEARREPAQLVLSVHVDSLGEILCLGHALDRRREPLDRT